MSYVVQRNLLLTFLLFYFFAGMYAVDRYPFFNWALFTKIPNEQTDYTLEVRSYDGRLYTPALPFSKTKFLFDAIGQSPTQYTQPISDLGKAIVEGDTVGVVRHRQFVERMFGDKDFSYTIFQVTYDPVELWRTGAYRSVREVATFNSTYVP